MHSSFIAKRVVRRYRHEVSASPGTVFPLLCPTREYDWIPGWSCALVHSDSGFAELGCIFKRSTPFGEGTWVVCRFEPPHRIGFVIVHSELMVETLDVEVTNLGEAQSSLVWTRTYTALSEGGNQAVERASATFDEIHGWLGRALDEFCRSGEMTREAIPAARG